MQSLENHKYVSVAITRSGDTGIQLQQRLETINIPAYYLPTLDIKSEELLVPMIDFERAIFISANAVKFSVVNKQVLKHVLPEELIAVGSATAKALENAGFYNIITPEQHSSEGLLALPQLQNVKGCQVLVVKGRGGRTLLINELTKRGAICHPLDVYYRVTKEIDKNTWQQFISDSKTKKMITIASIDAMNALIANLDYNFNYDPVTFVVASQRIADAASKMGYKDIVIAKSATNDAMIEAIESVILTQKV